MNGAGQSPENLQQMKKRVEQELKSDKYKSSSNKGYVFTLMPLYAIGVGVFAAYKFLKVTTYTAAPQVSDSIYSLSRHMFVFVPDQVYRRQGPKGQVCKRGQKIHGGRCVSGFVFARFIWFQSWFPHRVCVCVCFHAENQLNELEQRLAQTERMLNSILTQLDPLTNW